jgi:hypothetical protein
MSEARVFVAGPPGSGKTTYLAALWHLVTAREIPTKLKLHSLGLGSQAHLNSIAQRWRDLEAQDHTSVGSIQTVSMNLESALGNQVRLTFPDLSGETFDRMWWPRECDPRIAQQIAVMDGLLLFANANTIRHPRWLVDELRLAGNLGDGSPANATVKEGEKEPDIWDITHVPTQVILVEVLRLLQRQPLGGAPRKAAIVLSAWDAIVPEGVSPRQFLKRDLPLLDQYLSNLEGPTEWRIVGVSAQGGDLKKEALTLGELNLPSERIKVFEDDTSVCTHNDLTELLAWLVE